MKQKSLADACASIEKRFGKEALSGTIEGVEYVSSGSLDLDRALGGGYAKGRIIEIFGWESSGKSTLALHAVAEVQKLGLAAAYIDMEHAMDLFYAAQIGVDVELGERFILSQPENGENGLEIVREFLQAEEIGIIVVDSVTALIPKAVLAGEAGDSKMGLQARMMSQMIPTLIAEAKRSNKIVIFINQLREKIGVMFGNPQTTTGGNALKFYASQRVEVIRSTQVKDGDEVMANTTKVKVVKNKVAPPHRKAQFEIRYGIGIDKVKEIVDLGVEFGIIEKKGSWYSYEESKLGQGAEAVRNLLEDNPELQEELYQKIQVSIG